MATIRFTLQLPVAMSTIITSQARARRQAHERSGEEGTEDALIKALDSAEHAWDDGMVGDYLYSGNAKLADAAAAAASGNACSRAPSAARLATSPSAQRIKSFCVA